MLIKLLLKHLEFHSAETIRKSLSKPFCPIEVIKSIQNLLKTFPERKNKTRTSKVGAISKAQKA